MPIVATGAGKAHNVPLARHTTRRGVRGYGEPASPLMSSGLHGASTPPGTSRRLHDGRSPRSVPAPWIIERLRVSPGLTSVSGHAPRSFDQPSRGRLGGSCVSRRRALPSLVPAGRDPFLMYPVGHPQQSVSRRSLTGQGFIPADPWPVPGSRRATFRATAGRSYLAPCPACRIADITGSVPSA